MTVARKFHPTNRLAKLIKTKGGMLVRDAIIAAEEGVEGLREASLVVLDETLAEIELRFGASASNRQAERFEDLYRLTMRLIDVSTFVSDAGVDQAAVSLAGVADHCAEVGAWRWNAIDVHLDALRLLRSVGAELPAADRQAMIDGLYRVSHR
ncbi:hypothetical protein [Caulobacter henricii]|uniref:Chemotaxis protein CheE n=1 Tax=Caulobacter henricii TaxID=69395 RepID=A0A0P0NW78_9CAUL|nr:hypothetical protein [Caulobacter henricii]ALL12261.1 chemotaxis protein CheE [Caulobacter henricii]